MTWIRTDANAPTDPIIGALAEALQVSQAAAFGHWVATLCGLAAHQAEGQVGEVSDTTLEGWALWPGKAKRYAAAFRAVCVEHQDGQRDTPGTPKGWWKQQKLIDKQRADAAKRKPPKNPTETREKPPGSFALNGHDTPEKPPGYEDGNGTLQKLSSSSGAGYDETTSPDAYAQRCVAAVNRGLRANALILAAGGPRELVPSNEHGIALGWLQSGHPIELVEEVLCARAAAYRPKARRQQPHGLEYFEPAVSDAVARAAARNAEHRLGPRRRSAAPPARSELTRLPRLAGGDG